MGTTAEKLYKILDSKEEIKQALIAKGINITDENYQLVADIAKEKGIPIHRTRLKHDQYKIEIVGT
jgi:hypothetical protein